MRIEALLCALVVLTELSGAARADLLGGPADPPHFSAADSQIISHNELLRAIAEKDPWLVRRILDLMEQWRGETRRANGSQPEGLDPTRDPDLASAGRTAEGSVEWVELLKRARAEKDAREKEPAAGNGRSAEGSVELIEMMKRAKAAKDAGGK